MLALKSNQHKVLAAGEVIAAHIRVNLMARKFKGNTGCRLLGHLERSIHGVPF